MRKVDEKMRVMMAEELADHYSREGYFVGSWEVFEWKALKKIFVEMPVGYLIEEHSAVYSGEE